MIEALQSALTERTAPFVQSLNMRVVSASTQEVVVVLPVSPHVVHAANALCGQAIMAAMDTVMVLAIIANNGGERRSMATIQLQTSFLRGARADVGEVTFTGKVLRAAKTVAFGEVSMHTPDGKLCAHATTTYALL